MQYYVLLFYGIFGHNTTKASISFTLQYIEMTLVQLQEKKEATTKLYPSMGILGGMLIVVVLL